MQIDFHYYATYCAAYLAGYSHNECMTICYSDQFTDCCSKSFLAGIKGPLSAATTQTATELLDVSTTVTGLQDITRIWASFHFLPGNLYVKIRKGTRLYRNKYRLICKPNGKLVVDTIELARGKSLQAVGLSMHILADTWAHQNFAGTPSLVINNVSDFIFEIMEYDGVLNDRKIKFKHSPGGTDDIQGDTFISTVYHSGENSIMNLGHGRAGHLPDYSFIRYKYMPAWDGYRVAIKDNPSDYYHAFCQMVYAMKYLRGVNDEFKVGVYDEETVLPWKDRIMKILTKRQLDASEDWKKLGEEMSGRKIEDFDENKFSSEYVSMDKESKEGTFLGKFIMAALAQKSMVTNRIYKSGNKLAGFSIEYKGKGKAGIRDFMKLIEYIPEKTDEQD